MTKYTECMTKLMMGGGGDAAKPADTTKPASSFHSFFNIFSVP